MKKTCKRTVEANSRVGFDVLRYPCDRKAKYLATYISPLKATIVTEELCGPHKRALERNAARIKRVTGFDLELRIEEAE